MLNVYLVLYRYYVYIIHKWTLGSITTNKVVEVMEIQQSYFKS